MERDEDEDDEYDEDEDEEQEEEIPLSKDELIALSMKSKKGRAALAKMFKSALRDPKRANLSREAYAAALSGRAPEEPNDDDDD